MFVKSPGFSIVAFLAITLGLGVNTTIFGIVNTLLLRPLPIGHSDQLVRAFTTDTHINGKQPNSYLNFQDYAKENSVFSGMAGYTFAGMGMTRGAETLNVGGLLVSGSSDTTIKVWDLHTGLETLTLRGHDHWVSGVAFRPDGQVLLSSSVDWTLKLWDAGPR